MLNAINYTKKVSVIRGDATDRRGPTAQKRERRRTPQGFHPTRGPRTPFRKTNRREYKRRKRARARSRR